MEKASDCESESGFIRSRRLAAFYCSGRQRMGASQDSMVNTQELCEPGQTKDRTVCLDLQTEDLELIITLSLSQRQIVN